MKNKPKEFKKGNVVWSSSPELNQYNNENQPVALEIMEIKSSKAKCKFHTGGRTPITKTIMLDIDTLIFVREKNEAGISFSQQLLNKRRQLGS